jgi:hypothetical protein
VAVRATWLAGAPIDVPAGPRWPGRARRALLFGLDRDNAVVALAGFLVRGGIALLVLPGLVLPSVIGVAGAVGISSFAIDGSPTRQLFLIVELAALVCLAWLAAAGFVGSLVDVWLIEAAVDRGSASGRERALPNSGLLMDLVAVRGICLLPLAVAVAWAGTRIYSAAYAELMTPTNLVVPIFVRVVQSAADAVIVVAVAWLVMETVAGIAVRRMAMGGEGVGAALRGALEQIVRRPLTTVLTVMTWTAVSVATTAAAIVATATAFGWTLDVARLGQPIALTLGLGPLATTRDFRPVVFVLTSGVMAAAWIGGAAISGAASAWRSAAWTAEVASALGLPLAFDATPSPDPAADIREPI